MKSKIILVTISIFISLFTMEILIRIFRPVNYLHTFQHSSKDWTPENSASFPRVIKPSRIFGYELMPGRQVGKRKVNKLGFIDKERRIEKAKGNFRIVVLGDSITATGGETYVDFLEDTLSRNLPRFKFEVWNCAVPAYNTEQEFNLLKYKCLNFKPDLIMVQFCFNDFENTPLFIKEGKEMVIYWPKRSIAKFINMPLFKYSHLYRFIFFGMIFKNPIQYHQILYNTVYDSLRQIKDLLSSRNIELLVIIFPYFKNYAEYTEDEKWRYNSILNILDQLNVRFLDLTKEFYKINNHLRELSLKNDIFHPNLEGHKLAAEVIFKNLSDRLLLSKLR